MALMAFTAGPPEAPPRGPSRRSPPRHGSPGWPLAPPRCGPPLRERPAQEVDVQRLLRYQPLDEMPRYRASGNRWLRACGVEREDEYDILITSGAQHAGLVLTLALTEPGDLILADDVVRAEPQSLYLWLELGEGWRSAEFEAEARRRGVGVTPSRPFSVDASRPPDGVRICLSAAPSRHQLEEALGTLAHLLRNPGSRTPRLV